MLALTELGYSVSVPFGENTRYDLIVEPDGRLERAQMQTGRLRNGVILFRTSSTYAHHPNPKYRQRHYRGQIDSFAMYCPQTSGVYLIPVERLPADTASLMVSAPRNGQQKLIRSASDYEIAAVSVQAAEAL